MNAVRILHVDDEPDIREVVEMALTLDPVIAIRGCDNGRAALSTAAEWSPDLILLDVMMPGMDGPTTLSHLRENPKTADIPVIFMTARAQSRELDRFISLGAEAVIAKPFDPMTLAASVRAHVRGTEDGMSVRRGNFLKRARRDAVVLRAQRAALGQSRQVEKTIAQIRFISHSLAGAGGIFGLVDISSEAAALEDAAIDLQSGGGSLGEVEAALDALLKRIERA